MSDLNSGVEGYLISVINQQGYVNRRFISNGAMDLSYQVDGLICKIKEYKALRLLNECLTVEDYDLINLIESTNCSSVIEFISNRLALFIFGAGHVGKSLAILGNIIGYRVIILDDRDEFLRSVRFLGIDGIKVNFEHLELVLNNNSAVVIVTRGHQFDELCLKFVVRFNLKYIGMIGSQRRVRGILKRLNDDGISNELLTHVHAPVGLKINARTPMEIAISILAEIIRTVNDRGKL